MRQWHCILTISSLAFFLAYPAPAKIVYVAQDATGDGSGASWHNACTTITAGLETAQWGDEVWVKPTAQPFVIREGDNVCMVSTHDILGVKRGETEA